MFRNKLKGIAIFVFMLCITFIATSKVHAVNLTVDQVIEGINNSSIVNYYASSNYPLTIEKDTENHKIKIYNNDIEAFISMDYGDDYIEYENDVATITYEVASKSLFHDIMLVNLLDIIFDLAGYEDKALDFENGDFTNTYDTYGFLLTTESYNISEESEYGTSSMNGDLFRHFKITLDKTKIDTLIAQYGVDSADVDPNVEVIKGIKPTIEVIKTTEDSVTVQPHLNYVNFDPDYDVLCYIYRSESEDGEYVKLDGDPVSCIKESKYIDKDLKSNTTYYYKTVVTYGSIFSNPVDATTKKAGVNPKTGINNPIVLISVLFMIIGGSLLVVNRKRIIKQI